MVEKLQRLPLDVSSHRRYLHQDAGQTYIQKYQRWDHTASIQKQPSAGI